MSEYNILWITLDSVKAAALPVYGNTYCFAPNMERAAEDGIVFENAFCQMPKCVPVRPSQMMGRYPHADGLRALTGKVDGKDNKSNFVLTDGMPNIITFLKGNGYTTCHKGVNHLVDFDVYTDWFESTTDWDPYKTTSKIPVTVTDDEHNRAKYFGPVPDYFDLDNTGDAESVRQMCSFLENHSCKKPFFAYLDIRAPHPPYRDYHPWAGEYARMDIPVPEKASLENCPWTERVYRETYALEDMSDEKWRQLIRAYYSAISFNDMLVGRVLDSLEQARMKDSTIVIYTADHGDYAGEHGCVEKHDTILYDCHVHMPLVIQLPADLRGRKRTDCLVEMIDVAPTVLDLCGFTPPQWMQASSFADVIRGKTGQHKEAVFAQGGVERDAIERNSEADNAFFYSGNASINTLKQKVILDYPDFMMRAKMIRTEKHKLIYRLNRRHELYDLSKDPGELKNEADNPEYDSVITDLKEKLLKWMIESETNLPMIDKVWS